MEQKEGYAKGFPSSTIFAKIVSLLLRLYGYCTGVRGKAVGIRTSETVMAEQKESLIKPKGEIMKKVGCTTVKES